MKRFSLGALLLLVAAPAIAGDEARYTLEGGKIVVEKDGIFEDVAVDCEETFALVQHDGKLYVACGPRGIAIYSLADPTRPVLAGRVEDGPCVRLDSDGTCVVSNKVVRARFSSSASPDAIAAAACSLRAASRFDVRVNDRRCSAAMVPDGAIALTVRTERQGGSQSVVLDAELPEGASREELRTALAGAGRELRSRLDRAPASPSSNVSFAPIAPTAKEEAAPRPQIWYGNQTLIADGVSLAPLLLALGLSYVPDLCPCRGAHVVDTLAILGGFSYALASPIIHWAHGRVEKGLTSLGLRAGAGLIAGLAGGSPSHYGYGAAYNLGYSATGPEPMAVVGSVIAVAALLTPPLLDAAVFAYMPAPRPKQRAQIVPVVLASKNGATVGVAGSF